MILRWLGHASFLVVSAQGFRILIDPYQPQAFNGRIQHKPFLEQVDVVLISHYHIDHSCVLPEHGHPVIIDKEGFAGAYHFQAIRTFHDKCGGAWMGSTHIFFFTVDGITICHLGDLGCPLSEENIRKLGKVDVLLLPIGGVYTLNPTEAMRVQDHIGAPLTIPMHFRHGKCHLDIAYLTDFIDKRENVDLTNSGWLTLIPSRLPKEKVTAVLVPEL